MKHAIIFDTKDPARTQVRFKANYQDVEFHYVSTMFDFFEVLESLKDKPMLIILEAELSKDEKGMIFGSKRVRTPYTLVQFLKPKGYRFVIYTSGTKDKSLDDIKRTYSRLHIDVVDKNIGTNGFRKAFDRYLRLDFSNPIVKDFS
jgi:hypothetical protein